MNKNCIVLIIFTLLLIICLSQFSSADNINIYIYGKDVTSQLVPVVIEGQIMVRARSLADYIGSEIKWKESIKTLELIRDEKVIKMMVDSPYIQIGNSAVKSKAAMVVKDNYAYVPLKDVVDGFGFLINNTGNALYIFKPEAFIQEVGWGNSGRKLIIRMDKITPYRINEDTDPKKLVIEIDRAALAPGFTDNVSNKNYYFDIKKSSKTARLQLILTAKYPIPYYNESCIEEKENNIILNFYPGLEAINWTKDNKLELVSNETINKPDISLLTAPKRMVLDFSGLRLSDYQLNITENDYIKQVRVSQFKYEPLVLRVVLELKDNKYLHSIATEDNKKFVLGPAVRTEISELTYTDSTISFRATAQVEPEIFKLTEPDRLVINIFNAIRSNNIKEEIKINNGLVKGIRSSQFDDQVIRLVVDLKREIGYNWEQVKEENGKYLYTITLGNTVKKVEIVDGKQNTDINLKFYDEIKYKIDKFAYPDRLVVDILNTNINIEQIDIPDSPGIIKDIRVNKYNNEDKEYTRFVFELDDYNGHKVISENPAHNINITLAKKITEEITEEITDENKIKNLIIVDPGHGGFDPGACGPSGLTEKEVNLDIALKIKDNLHNSGYNVMLTREKDEFISLKERVQIANEAGGLVFVSIHNNSSCRNYSEGTETFLAPNRDGKCLLLAQLMQEELLAELNLVDRGVKKDNFYVIKYTDMPAILVEIAFLSNPHEEALLENELFRQKAAEAVGRAIINYLNRVN